MTVYVLNKSLEGDYFMYRTCAWVENHISIAVFHSNGFALLVYYCDLALFGKCPKEGCSSQISHTKKWSTAQWGGKSKVKKGGDGSWLICKYSQRPHNKLNSMKRVNPCIVYLFSFLLVLYAPGYWILNWTTSMFTFSCLLYYHEFQDKDINARQANQRREMKNYWNYNIANVL